jgi:hypothetical protein
MDARRLKLLLFAGPAAALVVGLAFGLLLRAEVAGPAPDREAVARQALVSVRDEGRLVPFTARFVAIVTATESRLGLTARKTLILPGTVRYGIDLTRLTRRDIVWDEATRTLTVTIPRLELSGPQIDFAEMRELEEGGMLMALTGAEEALDEANRRSAHDDLMRQARAAAPMQAAREAAMRIVARAFAAPLRASGIEATVAVRYLDASGAEEAVFLDRPRRIEETVRDRGASR